MTKYIGLELDEPEPDSDLWLDYPVVVRYEDHLELVTKLKGYAAHDDSCAKNGWEDRVCTCGLTELLGEME